jgi:hypothetical protein
MVMGCQNCGTEICQFSHQLSAHSVNIELLTGLVLTKGCSTEEVFE